jgi:N-acetyl-1-D-myo-inositol-2-amino-2-deoxy-alpha-D-glucopyranoside deacetylase
MLHLSQTTDGMPIGLVLALIIVGSLALALRILRRSRGALYLMALGFIFTMFQLGQNPGGSQLVTNGNLSSYWFYGSLAVLAIIVMFPRLRKATWNRSASGHR